MSKQTFDVNKFVEDKQLDETNISLGMTSNADLIGYYGYQESLWKSYIDNLKNTLETISAQIELDIKASSDKMTESTVKAKIAIHEDVKKLKKALAVAREQEMLYSNAIKTMDQRGRMLISLGAWMRAELSNMDMSISHNKPTTPRISPSDRREMVKERLQNSQ